MPDASSTVTIVFQGRAQGLEQALAEARQSLAGFGRAADKAGAQAGTTLARGEHTAAHEAAGLGERAKVAAEMVSLMGAESAESVLKVQGMGRAFSEAQHAFGGFGGALAATVGSFALFKGADFLRESVDAAMEGQTATAAYNAALGKTPGLLDAANKSLEEHRAQFTRLGIDDSAVMAMMARAAGKGLDPRIVSENADAFADLAVALRTDYGGAVDAVTRGGRGLTQIMTRLNLSAVQQKQLMAQLRGASPEQRTAAILALVERSSFAGAGEAQAGTATGRFKAFHTAVHNLQEEVGTALLPALTQLAGQLTGLLQAAEGAAKPFGGLANVIKVLFLPMLAGGLLLFTNLRGVMTRLVDLLLGRLVGSFAQTAQSMAEADVEARTLAEDIGAIPELATTTASFVPATAIKDAYKANIYSIPTTWTTTATFVPAALAVPVEPAMAPIHVPVIYDGALTESQGVPVRVPVVYDGTLTESQATPVRVPVLYGGVLHEAAPHPLTVPVRYAGAFHEATAHSLIVPVRYVGALHEATPHALLVPVHYRGTFAAPTPQPVTVPVRYSQGTLRVTGGTVPVEPVLAPDEKARAARIRSAIERDVEPVRVRVTPQWVHGAADSLKTGLGLGVGVAITDALFSSVTIKHVDWPGPPPLPRAATTPTGPATATSNTVRVAGTPHVYVTNAGAIGEALPHRVPHTVTLSGHPYVGLIGHQSVGISNVPGVKITSSVPIQTTATLPPTLGVKQSGHWQVSLAPDAFKRFGEMVGEIAIGTMLGNLFMNLIGKIPFGKIVELIKNLFRGKGGKGPGGPGDEEPPIPLLPQWSQSTTAQMLENLLRGEGIPANRSLVPVPALPGGGGGSSTFIVTGLVSAFKAINWGGILSAAGFAAKVAGAIGGMLLAAFGLLGKAFAGGPHAAAITSGPLALQIGVTLMQAILDGLHRVKAALATAIGTFFKSLMPHIGGSSSGSGGGGGSGFSVISPGTSRVLAQRVQAVSTALGLSPAGPGTRAAGTVHHHTHNVTLHAPITINGATDPAAVGRQIRADLTELVRGVQANRRLHG